ncbi:MAG TPA: LCP family protein [Nocardioidaceae bacterium]|nr:LCP family protein [Nocardioidaceae bacterium]
MIGSGSATRWVPSSRWRQVRRLVVLALVLAVTGLVIPRATVRNAPMSLVKASTASGVGHSKNVIWILCLGSDARPGQRVTGTRADAIQLVGLNLKTHAATDIGVPRDSWVHIAGHGMSKINASMFYGGPQLMADSVAHLVGIRPDYVFTAGFDAFRHMVHTIGGVTVYSPYAWSDPVRPQGYHVGKNKLTAFQALIFARMRHALPHGDFDRSADQRRLLVGILKKVRGRLNEPGFFERSLYSVVKNLNTDLKPSELYQLATALSSIEPRKFKGCVIQGSTGYVGPQSVVFANVGQAHRYARDARNDATLNHGC